MLRARVDRHRCIGAGNCITIAPTAFDWMKGDLLQGRRGRRRERRGGAPARGGACRARPTRSRSRRSRSCCPGSSAERRGAERRVLKTFMFTDIVKSTNLAEAMGDDRVERAAALARRDAALPVRVAQRRGGDVHRRRVLRRVRQPGGGDRLCRRDPAAARGSPASSTGSRRRSGSACTRRGAAQVEGSFRGIGVHEASRIAALAEGGEIVASRATVGSSSPYPASEPRTVELKGLSEPMEVVSVDWR